MSDYYNTLGVSKNSTPEDIKNAYKRLARTHHPDRGGNKEEFQKIQEGDTLFIFNTGSNTLSMWSGHCSRDLPDFVFY